MTDIGKGDAAGTPVTPTDGKGNNVYLCEIENAEGKPVTINGKSYPAKHLYHDGSAWTTEGKLYPYLPGDGSGQIIKVGDTTSVKLYSGTGFVDAPVVLLDSTGTAKGGYANLADAVTAAAAGDTIQLMGDVTITGSTLEIDKKLTLDLNGKTVSCDGVTQLIFVKASGDLTIRDGIGGGKIAARYFTAVGVAGSFTLEGGTVETSSVALIIHANATATLKGGTVKGQLQNHSGTLYADGGEVILGTANTNCGIITRHADATATTKFRVDIFNGFSGTDFGTIEAGEFYGDVTNVVGSTICGGTFNGKVTNSWNGTSAGIVKSGVQGGNYYDVTINGGLVFEGGKNCTGYNDATYAWTFVDVTKEYLTNTLKLGGTGYVQSGDTYYILGASGLHAAAEAGVSGGTLVLIKDVTIDKTLNITGTVTLDLDGHTLKYESKTDGSVIRVNNGANFTLKDSSAAKTGTITGGHADMGGGVHNMGGNFTMQGGTISGCSASLGGGGVNNAFSSTFTMKGGTISGCSAAAGGGVYNTRNFTIAGGKIENCTATVNGSAVFQTTGNTTMFANGGSIIGNVFHQVEKGNNEALITRSDDATDYTTFTGTVSATNIDPKACPYTVTFDSKGGSAVATQYVLKGQAPKTVADPTRENFTFIRWRTEGSTTAYDFSAVLTESVTLIADWNCPHPTTVTVGYKPDNHIKQWAGESGVTSCTVCGKVLRENTKIAPSAHRGGNEYASNDTEHWKTCTYYGCDAEVKNTREAHTLDDSGVCTTCGYKKNADYLRGDFDDNKVVDSDDAIYLLRHVFFGDQYPANQPADLNKDGKVTSDDAIYLLRHVFFPETYPLA